VVDYVFEPLHERLDLNFEGCADDEGLNSHDELPHYSPSDSIMERDLSGERTMGDGKTDRSSFRELYAYNSDIYDGCLFFLSGLSSTSSLDT
jgi:hypothetical protein